MDASPVGQGPGVGSSGASVSFGREFMAASAQEKCQLLFEQAMSGVPVIKKGASNDEIQANIQTLLENAEQLLAAAKGISASSTQFPSVTQVKAFVIDQYFEQQDPEMGQVVSRGHSLADLLANDPQKDIILQGLQIKSPAFNRYLMACIAEAELPPIPLDDMAAALWATRYNTLQSDCFDRLIDALDEFQLSLDGDGLDIEHPLPEKPANYIPEEKRVDEGGSAANPEPSFGYPTPPPASSAVVVPATTQPLPSEGKQPAGTAEERFERDKPFFINKFGLEDRMFEKFNEDVLSGGHTKTLERYYALRTEHSKDRAALTLISAALILTVVGKGSMFRSQRLDAVVCDLSQGSQGRASFYGYRPEDKGPLRSTIELLVDRLHGKQGKSKYLAFPEPITKDDASHDDEFDFKG